MASKQAVLKNSEEPQASWLALSPCPSRTQQQGLWGASFRRKAGLEETEPSFTFLPRAQLILKPPRNPGGQ